MSLVRTPLAGLAGLFVDDGGLALAVLLVCSAILAAAMALPAFAAWSGYVLAIALAVSLLESVLRRARARP